MSNQERQELSGLPSPMVSVLVITFNQAHFIRETLESILAQDYENLEIVVADDGSTDGADEIILEYARNHPAKIVPLVGGPNLGITGNSNRALMACRGHYIAFIGGDDIFLPGKISKQVEWFEADERRVLCGHQLEVFYDDGRQSHLQTRYLRSGSGPRDYIRHGTLYGALSVMVRRDCVPAHGFDPALRLVSDGLFFTEVLMGGGKYGYVEGVYGRYRRHADNITNQWERCVNDLAKYFDIVRERYPEYRRDADIGEANIMLYGYGLRRLNEGNLRESIGYLLRGIRINPLGYKLWVRLFQALLKSVIR